MAIYASVENVNTDPMPWATSRTRSGVPFSELYGSQTCSCSAWGQLGHVVHSRFEPRPEYQRQTIHAPNPVLVAFRKQRSPASLFIKGWWYPDVVTGWSGARFSERVHAHRVLSRYLAIFGEDQNDR